MLCHLPPLRTWLLRPPLAKPKPKPPGLVSALEKRVTAQPSTRRSVKLANDLSDDEDAVAEAEQNVDESCARAVIQRAKKVGSVLIWSNQVAWKNARNRRECQCLSEAIDSLIDEGLGEASPGLEILCRRLVGVQLADKTGNWNICEAVQGPSTVDSVLSRAMFSKALRDAASLRRLSERSKFKPRAVSFSRSSYSDSRSSSSSSDNRRPPQGKGGASRQ